MKAEEEAYSWPYNEGLCMHTLVESLNLRLNQTAKKALIVVGWSGVRWSGVAWVVWWYGGMVVVWCDGVA